jgi:hypothetical protein
MRLDRVQPGDVVRCSIKGRTGVWGEVTEIKDGVVYFHPLFPATGWRHASAREITGHWRKTGRRAQGSGEDPDGSELPAVSRSQLSLRVSP